MPEPTNPTPGATPSGDLPAHPGRKSAFEKFLDKNPELKAKHLAARQKANDPSPAEYQESDIANLDDMLEYLIFELTRSKNEDVLRGKTFSDYSKIFLDLYKLKIDVEKAIAETDAKCKKIIDDRSEIETFMKIIYEALAETVKDIQTRKEISDKIQTLYDKHYPTDTTQKADGDSGV